MYKKGDRLKFRRAYGDPTEALIVHEKPADHPLIVVIKYEKYLHEEVQQVWETSVDFVMPYDEEEPLPPPVYHDPVNHPKHYTSANIKCTQCDNDIECIDVVRHFNFNLGNVIKYIWRAGHKNDLLEDLKKAAWYLNDHIKQLEEK